MRAYCFRGKYLVESFEVPDPNTRGPDNPMWDGPYFGADWGFANDPTVLVKCWIDAKLRRLLVEREAWGVGVELDDISALFASVPGSRDHVIRADSSQPETISHVRQHGFLRIGPAEKWNRSVEDGIAFLRSFEKFVVHPRCTHTTAEMRFIRTRGIDSSGDVLPVPIDKDNHANDSLRYACEPMVGHQDPLWVWSRF